MLIRGLAALLLLIGSPGEVVADRFDVGAIVRVQAAPAAEPVEEGRIFKWEQDLRWFTFRLLKDIRRYGIRTMRLLGRSSDYWLAWLTTSALLLLFGALVSAVDRRLLGIAWKSGARIALAYASVGILVFLRLLRDRRVRARLRAITPLAILYGLCATYWLAPLSPALVWVNQLAAVAVAARWFVRRCPDEVVEQHADYVRQRTLSQLLISSGQRPS